jgi:hypothetical protein
MTAVYASAPEAREEPRAVAVQHPQLSGQARDEAVWFRYQQLNALRDVPVGTTVILSFALTHPNNTDSLIMFQDALPGG